MPERSAQLYAAAVELFAEQGYRDVGVDDIVARCGVSRATFYGYFRNKRDLLSAILGTTEADLVELISVPNEWAALEDLDAYIADLHSLIRRVLQYVADNAPLLSFVVLTAPGVDADAYASLLAGYQHLGAEIEGILEIASVRGWLVDDSAVNLVCAGQMVVSCVAASALPLLLGTDEHVDIAEVSQLCGDYLFGGMRAVLPTSA